MTNEELLQEIKKALETMKDDEERENFIYEIKDFVCFHCGSLSCGGYCIRDD